MSFSGAICALVGNFIWFHYVYVVSFVASPPRSVAISSELFEGDFEVFDNLLGENFGMRKIARIFEAFVFGARRCRRWPCRG